MTTLAWSDEYSIGIDVIDRQHQRILDYINQVYNITADSKAEPALQEVLNNLIDYTYSHFEFEEALMEEAEYDDLDGHQLTHKNFCHLISKMKERFDRGEPVAVELAEMLNRWLLNHIVADDRSYAEIVRQNILHEDKEQHRNWVRIAIDRYFR